VLTIVWDVDDVLNDLMYQWFVTEWVPSHPDCLVAYSGLAANPPHASLGATLPEYLESMDLFRKSDAGIALTPNPEVLAWFSRYGSHSRHIALTARPLESAPEVAAWVFRHFGKWIRCFGVVPSRQTDNAPEYDQSKGDFLRWLGKGDILVDDTPANLEHAQQLGLKAFAWPQPWNGSTMSTTEILHDLATIPTVDMQGNRPDFETEDNDGT
jgi:hypothetical protein